MIAFVILGLLILALFGAPLFTIVASGALLGFIFIADVDSAVVIQEMYRLASQPILVAIPLFTFAGYILAESNAPKRMVRLTQAILGWLPGGLAIVVLVASAIFTAFTGASGITIVALGGLFFPVLLQAKYKERFCLGLVTCTGSLGLLFPPSLPIILYGLVSKTSVNKLFIAGIIPGIVILVLLILYSMFIGRANVAQRAKFSIKEIILALRSSIFEAPLPLFIVWGIYAGKFTVSEAASVTAVWVLITEVLIYRDIKVKDLMRVIRESMMLVGAIIVILGMALSFTNFLIDQKVPDLLIDIVRKHMQSKITFLIALNILLIIVGCLMDIFSAIIVVVPLIIPISMEFGVDPIHLGIIFLTNLEIGYLTPPVGLNLFISSFRFGKPIISVYRAAVPFILILLVALLIITYIPKLSLYLVELSGVQ